MAVHPRFHRISLLIAAATVSVIVALPAISAAGRQTDNRGMGVRVRARAADGSLVDLYDESHALVIGVSKYLKGLPSLPGVLRDTEAVRAVLEKHGFQVETLTNPTRAQFDQAMRGFIRKWGQAPGNRLLIYFAGHGYTIKTVDGRELGYIVPADAPLPTKEVGSFKEVAVSMDEIEVYARRIESKHVMFVFDSCFSGSLFEVMRAVPDAIANKTGQPVRQFITAGTADQEVPDNSIFTKQFVEGLNGDADLNRDGYVTGSELGMFLENTVTNYSRRAQTPRWGKIRDPRLDKGDFVFVVPGQPASGVIQPTPERHDSPAANRTSIEIEFWRTIQDSANPEDFKAYLKKYPAGEFVQLAKIRLAKLEPTKRTTTSDAGRPGAGDKGSSTGKPAETSTTKPAPVNADPGSSTAKPARESATKPVPAESATQIAHDGDRFVVQGKFDDAVAAYSKSIELEPANALWRTKLALVLGVQKKYTDAEREFREATRLEPQSALWHYNLGLNLYSQQRLPDAAAEFRQAVKLDPKNTEYAEALKQTEALASKPPEGASQPAEANAARPNGGTWLATLKWISLRKKEDLVYLIELNLDGPRVSGTATPYANGAVSGNRVSLEGSWNGTELTISFVDQSVLKQIDERDKDAKGVITLSGGFRQRMLAGRWKVDTTSRGRWEASQVHPR
jgi:tetratricopeptide (TPR) repeat protein